MAQPWTDTETETLIRLHGEGLSLNAIARRMERGNATITRKAKAAGLSFDRAPVKAANEARTVDARARKLGILEAQLAITEKLQAQALAPHWQAIMRGEGGAEYVQPLDHVPARDAKDMMSALNSSSTIIARLDDNASDHDDAKSVIGDLVQGLTEDYQRRHQ